MNHHHMQALEPRQLFATILDLPDARAGISLAPSATFIEPAITMKARWITDSRFASQVITVTYRTLVQVDFATLGNRDIRVTGPDGYRRYAKLDSFIFAPNGSTIVRYKLSAPNGKWDVRANGPYTVSLVQGAVRDIAGDLLIPRKLGTFRVAIPPPVDG